MTPRASSDLPEFSVYLGSSGNHDLWGNPLTGWVRSIGTVEGCRNSYFGDRGYFRSTRYLLQVNEAGRDW